MAAQALLRAASVVLLAAASLAGGRSSIGHHDAVRRRLSQTPDGCVLYIAGPVVASKGNQVATVDSLQDYELTFTMELASDWVHSTGEYQSILHIGDTRGQRFPSVLFRDVANQICAVQSHSYCDPCCCQYQVFANVNFAAGGTYDFKMVVQNNQMTVYIDGVSVGTSSGSSTYAATDAAVYIGEPSGWHSDDATKVTLSDITLSEIALADACRENVRGHDACGCPADFPYQSTTLLDICYTDVSYANAGTGPCGSWCTFDAAVGSGCGDNSAYMCSDACDLETGYIFQAGRCYPQSEAPVINTVGLMSSTIRGTGTPQECYDYCTANSGYHYDIMGLDLRPTGGQDCQCKVAEDDYNDGADCKRRAVTSTAIEDMDWSSMTEDYVCFTETFDADAELSELCGDVVSDAAGSSSSNGKDSDNEGHLLMILIILPTLLLAVIAWAILVMIKRRKLASICDRLRRPSAAAPPAHEPTPLSPSTLASIEASNLKVMGMMSEEPPQAAEPVAEAINLPHGHVSGAEAAAMAEGEPPPQESVGWGRRSLQRLASWKAVEEPPPPPAAEAYAPEAELDPEC